MVKLTKIGHILLLVTDLSRSRGFYRDTLGFQIVEEDPEHGGTFMTFGDATHTVDLVEFRGPKPPNVEEPSEERQRLGVQHVAFQVASHEALRDAYFELLDRGVRVLGAVDHESQRACTSSILTATPSNSIAS